jgi:antitoxin component YwqK of YwqJK toxin-antitoxin module
MKKRTTSDSITILDWMKSKPYKISKDTYDLPYLKLCKGVFGILNTQKSWFDNAEVDRELRKELACMLVSYFEDFICEIGIWSAFIERNNELHGYYLPFYELTDYDPDHLNVEDIAYIIWHFMTKCLDTRIHAPDSNTLWNLAIDVYDLLEPAIEDISATDVYDEIFAVADGSDFFDLKTKLDWFSTKSYLMGWELGAQLEYEIADLLDEKGLRNNPAMMEPMIYTLQEDYKLSKRCSFAAMNAPEWFARVARCSEVKKQEIINLQFRHQGQYLYLKEEENHYLFRHLTTDREYKVRKDSVKKNGKMGKEGKTVFLMTLIQWEGEWMLTGMMTGWDLTPKDVENAKNKQVSTPWIFTDERLQNMRETTDLMYKSFVEFFGSPLALFGSKKELEQGSADFFSFYNKKLGSTDAELERRQKVYQERFATAKSMDFSDLPKGDGYGMLFVEGIGITMLTDLQDTIISLKKPSLTKEEQVDLFYDLLVNYEPAVAGFLLQTFGHQNFRHPSDSTIANAWRERHFYWRFYNPQEFGAKYPMMTMVDTSGY